MSPSKKSDKVSEKFAQYQLVGEASVCEVSYEQKRPVSQSNRDLLIIDDVKKDLDQESNNNKAHTSITTKMQSINAILDKIEMNTDNNHPLEQEDE